MGLALAKEKAYKIPETIELEGIIFKKEEIESGSFMEERSYDIAENLAGNLYFTQYYPENRVRDLEECAAVANAFLESSNIETAREQAQDVMSDWGESLDWHYDQECLPQARTFLENLREEAKDYEWEWPENGDEFDHDLAQVVQEVAQKNDDSSPEDVLSSCDRAEIMFKVMPREKAIYQSDWQIESCNNYPNYENLAITPELMEVLSFIGYSLKEYRDHSKNKNKKTEPSYRAPRKSEVKLISLDEFSDLVENSCNAYFYFGIYAQVPLAQLLNVDINKPIILSEYSVCTMSDDGTFYDIKKKKPIVLRPEAGVWAAFEKSGPSKWCCMSNSYYQSNISN